MASSDFWPSARRRSSALPRSSQRLDGCILNGLAGIRTQGLCLAKAALYQLSYKPLVQLPSSTRSIKFKAGCYFRSWLPFSSDRGGETLGGDPAADSPTATLLRLNPPCKARIRTSPTETASFRPYSGGLTGGVCKEQGRIHRVLLKRDYYGFQLHEGELQPSIRTKTGFRRFPSPFGVDTHCTSHCSPRVARDIRGILTYRCPFLPPL
jgi:hypothetical protein